MNTKIILLSFISGLSTVVGCLVVFISKKYKSSVLSFSFGLACSVMFLISVMELVPESISYGFKFLNIPILFMLSFCLLIIGGGVVWFLDKNSKNNNKLYNIGWLCMLSVLIHNIPEGIITSITLMSNYNFGLKMFFLILIHNIPEGISIAAPIYYSGNGRFKSIFYSLFSGGGEILGAILGIFVCRLFNLDVLLYILLMIVAGIMIYLSCKKLFFEGLNSCNDNFFVYGIIVGIFIVIFTL